MKTKASLHLHSTEDFRDHSIIDYSARQLIDQAVNFGFSFLALTGHEKSIFNDNLRDYAFRQGVILIPGLEANIKGKHILLLNCECINDDNFKSFEDLEKYKKQHPEIFVIAPHPNHGFFVSLGLKSLKKISHLFDGIEHSWHYTKFFNPNLKTKKLADELSLPFIATSDLHDLNYLNTDYIEVDVNHLDVNSFFVALRNGNFTNITHPKKIMELFSYHLLQLWKFFKYHFQLK